MLKFLALTTLLLASVTVNNNSYEWKESVQTSETIEKRISVPDGFKRITVEKGSFGSWLRNLPLKPEGTNVKLWDGYEKYTQYNHVAVVDIDFIGKNLQQCIDIIIRLRSEYLRSVGRDKEIAFTYSCCTEKIPWEKWKNGWRTKIRKEGNKYVFDWVKSKQYDNSYKNFRSYLFDIMMYAGTYSLSRDMNKIPAKDVTIGDAYVQGGAPGMGHGVIILDMAESPEGKKIMLLGQSYNPAENLNILKSFTEHSPWFDVDFESELNTPEWTFDKSHARRF